MVTQTEIKKPDHSSVEVVEASTDKSTGEGNMMQSNIDFESIDFFSDATSDALIKAHNDALDGKSDVLQDDEIDVEVNSEADAQIEEAAELSEGSAVLSDDVLSNLLDKPFFGFDNARSFMSSGQSMAGITDGLRKPVAKVVSPEEAVGQAMDSARHTEAGAQQDPRINMTLGKAALLMGGMGLMKLGEMIGGGGSLISSGIGKIYNLQQEKALRATIDKMEWQIDALRNEGLGQLEDKGVLLGERQNIAKQFFSQPEKKKQLEELFDQANRIKQQARLMIEKGLRNGESPDSVMDRVLEPMRRFTEQNESFLESVQLGQESLLEKMDGAMNGLFEMIKQIFQKIANSLGISTGASSGAEAKSSPKLG